MPSPFYADSEFHRRRAETEMEKALAAGQPDVAMRHLELARAHRERREALTLSSRQSETRGRAPIACADKEA